MHAGAAYRHEALFYAGSIDFVERIAPFITDGLSAAEPVLVAAQATKLDLLRQALATDAERVTFIDIGELGRKPARLIPAWLEFVDRHGADGRPLRGVGEPVWPERTADELTECERHEALLNLALPPVTPLWLRCPYDVGSLAPAVIDEARVNHLYVAEAGTSSLIRSSGGSARRPTVSADWGCGSSTSCATWCRCGVRRPASSCASGCAGPPSRPTERPRSLLGVSCLAFRDGPRREHLRRSSVPAR